VPSRAVQDALDLLAEGDISIKEAARVSGAPYTTVQNNWHGHQASAKSETPPMELDPGEVPTFVRDYSHLDKLHVFPLGDVHMGSGNFQEAKWDEWCAYVEANDHCSMLGTGDFLNVAIPDSVSDSFTEVMTVPKAKRAMREKLRPIAEAGRLDLLIPGNHEARITKRTGDCPIEDIAEALDVNYGRAAVMVVYVVGDIEYEVFLTHGHGSGRAGAQATRMERTSQTIVADIYVTGHTHRQQILRGAVFEVDYGPPASATKGHLFKPQVRRRRQLYVSSGSFLSYEEYAARFGLSPADIGCPRIRLDGRRKDAHASI
jgi:hypothetical protein